MSDPLPRGAGMLTMAYGPRPYLRMAKGLARSIRLRSAGVPTAIVTDAEPSSLRRWFDIVVPLNPAFGPGLAQKLHLDHYTPFDRTLYIDSDFLLFDDAHALWDEFDGVQGLGVFGHWMESGEQHYAVEDLPRYLSKLGLSRMVMTNTGVLYFDRSLLASRAFEMARTIARDADCLGVRRHPVGSFNDEPIFGAVAAKLDLPLVSPDTRAPAFTLGSFGADGMTEIDVLRGRSRHSVSGRSVEPVAIHFNVQSQGSDVYDRELRRLELGPVLGRSPLPGVLTAARRSARRAGRRARELAWMANGWPFTSVARRPGATPEQFVRLAAERARAPFTFVQIGSNDGRTGDPLFGTVMITEVRGVLIEPVPELFERLRATYAGKDGLTFVNAAVAETEGRRDLYWVPPAPDDPEWSDQLGSFSRDVVLGHADEVRDLADRVVTVSVACRTLASVVAEHGLSDIDLLHIDAEGYDLAILRTIDFAARWAPRCVLYEQKHLGADRTAARDLLRAAGYSVIDLGSDAFAFRGLRARLGNVFGR